MTAYYNEFDPKAASWLRQLIINGDIAPGEVDERSIIDVEAADLKGFSQHHFFAGIGVWSHALRNAGWSDDRPVCTASLPCQPFSAAGNQKGKDDERHLLPHFLELVKQCNFHTIIGEQVEAAMSAKHTWLDDLYTEMENQNYAVGAAVIGAHSFGKPHIRKRIYWVAHSINEGSQRRVSGRQDSERENINRHTGCDSTDSRVGNTNGDGCKPGCETAQTTGHRGSLDSASGIDWLYCRDGKHRPVRKGINPLIEVQKAVKSGIEPLADGATGSMVCGSDTIDPNNSAEARTIRLKGYGNAIVAPVAEAFIRATMEVIDGIKTL